MWPCCSSKGSDVAPGRGAGEAKEQDRAFYRLPAAAWVARGASWGEAGPLRGHEHRPLLPMADGEGFPPARSIRSSSEERACCCLPSAASGRKTVPQPRWLWWEVRLSSPPPSMQNLLELTHRWPRFPTKLGAAALPAPCNVPLASPLLFSSL